MAIDEQKISIFRYDILVLLAISLSAIVRLASGQVSIHSIQQIETSVKTSGSSVEALDREDFFGGSATFIGDLDGDHVNEMVVGAAGDDDGGRDRGSVWVLFLKNDGSVKKTRKISATSGRFTGDLNDNDKFGSSVTSLGDLDDDGVTDLAVGAPGSHDARGAVWILFLNRDGTVKKTKNIGSASGDFSDRLQIGDNLGSAVACLDDLDGDGIPELAVGAEGDDDGGPGQGAVWVLFLNNDGTAKDSRKISATEGNFNGDLADFDAFGSSLTSLVNPDGHHVLAVGAPGDDDGGTDRGAVWVLFLDENGTVDNPLKISATAGGFTGELDDLGAFGSALTSLGDLDDNGVSDLAVGAERDNDGGFWRGAVWVLFLDNAGAVEDSQKISATAGGFTGELANFDAFGSSLANIGDLNADGIPELVAGASGDDNKRGATWILYLSEEANVIKNTKIGNSTGSLPGKISLRPDDRYGSSASAIGDIDGDGIPDLVVGAMETSDGGVGRGAVWVLFLSEDGTVRNSQKISHTEGGFDDGLQNNDNFGSALAGLSDLDGDNIPELVVGASGSDEARGVVWILFLNRDGTVKRTIRIGAASGGFAGNLQNNDNFGSALSSLGDLNGDSIPDLAVGAAGSNEARGAVWILFLNDDATVSSHREISMTEGYFTGRFLTNDNFGGALASPGDLNSDGLPDLAVGAIGDDEGGTDRGAVWMMFLNKDGTVMTHQKIDATESRLTDKLDDFDAFGSALSSLGDLDDDGVAELAVGAEGDDDGGSRRGAVWVLFLNSDGTVKYLQKISATEGGFTGELDDFDAFGSVLTSPGDLDDDGVAELAAGTAQNGERGDNNGVIWIFVLNTPPRISDVSLSEIHPSSNQPVQVSANVSDNGENVQVMLGFRQGGEIRFSTVEMDRIGEETFKFDLPEDRVSTRGIDYYVQASDEDGSITTSPEEGFYSLEVYIPNGIKKNTSQPGGRNVEEYYRLISVPLDLDNKNPLDVLKDLKPYDNTKWRLFELNANQTFVEFPDISEMSPGKAYFLIVRDTDVFISSGPGKTIPTNKSIEIDLHPGWNLVGNPFNFSIPVTNVRKESGEQTILYSYSGQWLQRDDIEPFEGYAVYAWDVDKLIIDPDLSAETTKANALSNSPTTPEWSISIRAQTGDLTDANTSLGVIEEAFREWDVYDQPEPPSFGNYISVYLPHPEWEQHVSRYTEDFRPPFTAGEVWSVQVATNVSSKVRLNFEGVEHIPSELEVWLIDEVLHSSQNLRELDFYEFVGTGDEMPHPFKIVVGDPAFSREQTFAKENLPAAFDLFPNFPNPFRGATTIPFALPVESEVNLIIYDMLGQKVSTLQHGTLQRGGFHSIIWDGRNDSGHRVASGVYFVQLTAGSFVQTRKMVYYK